MVKGQLFCFGLGYAGQAIGKALMKEGWTVSGTCRGREKQQRLKKEGFHSFCFDGAQYDPEMVELLLYADHVLSTVPPSGNQDPVLTQFGEMFDEVLDLSWIGYLSTTGVYGDQAGEWALETTTPNPKSKRNRTRLQIENAWHNLFEEHGHPVHRFRLAAIYGPKRNTLERVKQGTARRIDKPGLLFSRIHIEDVVQVIRASINKRQPGQVYNLGDDLPVSPEEVVNYGCSLLGVEPPPLQSPEEAELSELATSFYQDSKRIANKRIKEELGVQLKFPDYKAGLNHLLANLQKEGSQ